MNPRANNGKIMIQKWTGGGSLPISSGTFSGRGAAADTAPLPHPAADRRGACPAVVRPEAAPPAARGVASRTTPREQIEEEERP